MTRPQPERRTGRDALPERRRLTFLAYLAVIAIGAAVGMTGVAAYAPLHGVTRVDLAVALVAGFVVLDLLHPLVMPSRYDPEGLPISISFLLALMIATGPLLPLALIAGGTLTSELVRRRAPWRAAFNAGQYVLSWLAAWAVLLAFGLGQGGRGLTLEGAHLLAVVGAAVAYVLVNNLLVSAAIALRGDDRLLPLWWRCLRAEVGVALPLLACAPLVVTVVRASPWQVPLLLLPVAAVHLTVQVTRDSQRATLHDALTGLPNRMMLRERIEAMVAAPALDEGGAALLLLDVDRFKEVNDTLGHDTGDALLQQIATRLEGAMRPGDLIARLGGDEFAVLIPALGSAARAAEVAERVQRVLQQPFEVAGMLLTAEASVGVALFPEHAADTEMLLRCADVAMYQAKQARRGVQVYHPDADHHSAERLALLGDLRHALDSGGLAVHFQPMADAHSGRVAGVEALVRWNHPRRGLVPPDEFVPLAEQSGLMRPLTEFVLEASLRNVATWRRNAPDLTVAVNISARDLCDRDFVPHVRQCLSSHGLSGTALVLEVTERTLADDDARAVLALQELTALGVRVSLDDFGTGYSSLGRLVALPVGEIKVDRSFVSRLDLSDDAPIVRSVVELAHAMGLAVVAEGVETARAWRTLADMGCDVIQGWYLGRAMPAENLTAWLAAHRAVPLLAGIDAEVAARVVEPA